uniref:hemagglutinin repeat-containing protein n=1 Tax=Xanthomonas albilineans TaxID=29447 RepID=UPI0027DDFABF|nr:hemagglutinin repeat-containing protein [Xanthomonas albilineans]
MVIANPAGIQVDGGGFLNASRVTLTTGTPLVSNGALDGYRVSGGTIQIMGAGLDSRGADYTGLLARAVQINAGIWANQVQAVLGSNVVSADQHQITAQAASGAAPAFALDVGALGGMFANKIWLIGNEHGVGVRNAGNLGAQAGELVVTVDGRLENSGALQSQQDTQIAASGGIANAGVVSARGTLQVSTAADVDNRGGTLNAQRLQIAAATLRNQGGKIEQTGMQALGVNAGSLSNRTQGSLGTVPGSDGQGNTPAPGPGTGTSTDTGGAGNTASSGTTPNAGSGQTTAGAPLAPGLLTVTGALDNDGGRIDGAGPIAVSVAAGLDNSGGRLGVAALSVRGDLRNQAGTLAVYGDADLQLGALVNDQGHLDVANALGLNAASLSNQGGSLRHGGSDATAWHVQGLLDNTGGVLSSNAAAWQLDAQTVVNVNGRIAHSGTQGLSLTAQNWSGAGGQIATPGALVWRAGSIDHRAATASASVLDVQADSLDNRGGGLLSTGTQAASVQVRDLLDNGTGGSIASNGDLRLGAGTFGNAGGQVQQAGNGMLRIAAGSLAGSGGRLLSNGGLTVSGGAIDLSGGTTSAQWIGISADSLSTAGGTLLAAGHDGAQLTIGGTLDNTAGTLSSNGDVTVQAGRVLNRGGSVVAAGGAALQIAAASVLDNSQGGRLAASGDVSVRAAALDNTQGAIEHAGAGTLSVAAQTLQGAGGKLLTQGSLQLSGGDLELGAGSTTQAKQITLVADTLNNAGGHLMATGDQAMTLRLSGALDNDGGSIAGNGALAVQAGALSNRGGTLTAAGSAESDIVVSGQLDNTQGTVASNGSLLSIAADQLINAHGTLSHTGSQGLRLTANGVTNTQGSIVSSAALTLAANTVDQRQGTLGAASLQVQAGTLDNSGGGRIVASGNAASVLHAQRLNNAGGTVASNGDLTLQATSLDNTQGAIQHAGSGQLQIAADTLSGSGGSIVSNGTLGITGQNTDLSHGTTSAQTIGIATGTLSTAGGHLTASGTQALNLNVGGTLDNTGGTIAGNGVLALNAQRLLNAQGSVQAAGQGLSTLRIAQDVQNQQGKLLLGGAGQFNAASLANQGGIVSAAGNALQMQVDGALDNHAHGVISSAGQLALTAGTLDNSSTGTVVAGSDLSGQIGGALDNDAGILQASGAVQLQSAGLSNRAGSVVGGTLSVDTQGQALDNSGGTLGSQNGALALHSGALINAGGRVQAKTDLSVQTDGQAIVNTGSGANGGLLAGGHLQVDGGRLDNRGGVVFAQGDARLGLGSVDNSAAGSLSAAGNLALNAATLNNAGGRVQGGQSLALALGGDLNNQAGLLAANGLLSLTAATLDNRNTFTASNALGVQAGQLQLRAQALNNQQGQLLSNGASSMQLSAWLDNSGGRIASGGSLNTHADAVTNTAGMLRSQGNQFLAARALSGDGQVQSQGDLGLSLHESLTNTGQLIANGNLSVHTDGDLLNQGVLRANTLDLSAANVDNAASGEMSSQGVTHVQASGQLTNRGLIDGALTQLQAGTVDNVGTGRVYGDHVAIAAGTLLNRAESVAGVTHAATVAARQRLDIGVGQLTNTDSALLYSDGDAAIGGALDGNSQATGNANRVDNLGSTIEIAGTLALHASALNNIRQNVVITQTTTTAAPVRLDQPSWRNNGQNAHNDLRSTSNYSAYEVYYLNPQDILQDTVYTTPDGYQVHQATIRLTPQTSAYFFASGALYGATGERSRLDPRTGTVTIYYTGRDDNNINPDQVSSGASDPFAGMSEHEPGAPEFHYESDTLTYSNAYGTCTRNCVRLIAQYAYTDPNHILSHPQGTGGGGLDDNEQYRIATRTTMQDVLQPGVGPDAVIHSGGAMHLVTDNLHNTYARIAAGGDLSIDGITGAASVTNLAQTLYRTDSFNNVSHAYNGTTRQWSNPSISVQIGQIGGSITSGGTLHIDVGTLSNLNQGRAAPNVQDGSVLANLGVQGAQGAVSGGGVGPLHGPGGVSGSSAAQAQSSGAQRASTGNASAMDAVSGQGTVGGSVAVNAAGGSPDRIVMGTPNTQLPSASLFSVQPNGGHALVETDPRFTNYRVWLSSDAQLRQLGYNADTMQQRLGDGYYEQKLVREQIGQLTGRRFLEGYSSDEAQYQALLEAGATVGKAWGLRPGVALTAAQMAQLTSDIVWLVAQTVTLPDGRTTTALVPQVYLRLHPGDLDSGGALLAGANVDAHVSGTLTNTGTIAGRQLVSLEAGRIEHLGGSISGNQVALSSASDIDIHGASVSAVDALSVRAAGNIDVASTVETLQGGGHQEAITRVAGLYVTGANGSGILSVVGGGDVTLQGAQVRNAGTDGVTQLVAGHDLTLGAQTLTHSTDATHDARNYQRSSETTHAVSSVQGAGDVVLAAGHDVTLQAAQIGAGKTLAVQAGHDIDSQAVVDSRTQSNSSVSKRHSLVTSTHDEHVQGTQLGAGSDIVMRAGNDLTLASTVVASQTGGIALAAGHDVALTATQEQHDSVVDEQTRKKKFLSSKTTTTHDESHDSLAVTSSLSGDTVQIAAGNDLLSQGAQIVGTGDVVLAAGNNLTLETAQNTHSEEHDSQRKKSGLFGNGGLSVTYGKQSLKTDTTSSTLTHTGSTVGSLDGNVTLVAGNTLAITGSDVMALQGDITAKAKDIAITEVHDTRDSTQKTAFKQGGLTASVTSAALNLAQGAVHSAQAGSQAKGDARMQALAGASAAYSAYGAGQAMGKLLSADSAKGVAQGAGLNVAITVGGSRSHSESTQHSDTSKGSTLHAGGNVTLIATGGGDDSNLLIRGSDVKAGNNLLLAADHDITVESAQDSSEQHSRSKSGSAAIGAAISYGAKGAAMGFTANASTAHGQGDGTDVTQRNSHLSAGNTATILSGNDTTLDGAVLSANTVMADVGGDLHIHSEQDTSHYASHDTAASASVTVGIGASGSASYSHSKVDGDFASVREQSGIQAGDGGFDITVHGNTDLKGAVIASTQGAIDQGRNRLSTGTLTVADITNTSHYKATGVNLSGGYAAGGSDGKSDGKSDGSSGDTASSQMPSTVNNGSAWSWQNQGSGARGTAAGYDSKSGSQTSITHSGISGGDLTITDAAGQQARSGHSIADTLAALNRDVHTGDSGNGLVKDWNGQQLQQQVKAGAEIMATFGQQASKAIGDYASQKALELRAQGNEAEAAKWDEGGAYRVAAHAAMGALGGGVQGALGAGAAASAAPRLNELTKDLPDGVREAVGAGLAAGLGAVTGGASGAATAFNEDTNNRQLHPVEMSFLAAEAAKYAEYAKISEKEAMQLLIAATLDQIDSTAQAKTSDQDAAKYQSAANWLASEAADAHLGFVNEKGELQQAFTATKSQFYDPTLYDQPYRGNILSKIADKVFDTHLTAGHSITMDDYLAVASDLKLEGQYQLWRSTRPADMSKWSADDLQTMSAFVQKNDLRLMAKLGILGPIGANWVSLSDGDYKGVVDSAALNIAGGVVPVGSVGRSLEHGAETASEISGEVRGVNGAANAGADGQAAANAKIKDYVRPTHRESELDVGGDLGANARAQVSFKDGQEVPYGTPGSVRPDWCLGNVCSVEVKNYNIDKNQQGLIDNVSKQAVQRAENLPQGMAQQVVIDVRGQTVTPLQRVQIIRGIVDKSGGRISPSSIRFKTE